MLFLPRITLNEVRTALNALISGNSAIIYGAAARLSLSDTHIPRDTRVRAKACTVMNIPAVLSAVINSDQAVIPKKAAGASASRAAAFVHSRAAKLLRIHLRLVSTSVRGVSGFPDSAHSSQSLYADIYVSGAAAIHLARVKPPVTAAFSGSVLLNSSIGSAPPR